MKVSSIKIADINTDSGTQTRVMIDTPTVCEYAEAMGAGAKFPAVTVFYDGTGYYMADGFHRILAAASIGMTEIEADVRAGTRKDALIFALGANVTNGLRRTNADKRKCVEMALEEFADWSDRKIAETCGVSNTFVGKLRAEVSTVHTCRPSVVSAAGESHTCPESGDKKEEVRTGKDGKAYKKPRKPTPRETTVKAHEDAEIRSWNTGLNRVQRFISGIADVGGPASILDKMPTEDRKRCALELMRMAELFRSWAALLKGQELDAMIVPAGSPATVEPGKGAISPADEPADPVSQQAISENIETVGQPVVAAQDSGDPDQPEWKRYASHRLQEIKRERKTDTSEMGHGKSEGRKGVQKQ